MSISIIKQQQNKIFITGVAGFIGSFLAKKLLEDGYHIIGLDNINDYYDVKLKHFRLDMLKQHPSFTFIQGDLANKALIETSLLSITPRLSLI